MKFRVVTAEGGQVLGLLLSWRSTYSFLCLIVPMAPELSGDLPGWASAWACCREVRGALGPREAGGTEGREFALEIGKETVFSGR